MLQKLIHNFFPFPTEVEEATDDEEIDKGFSFVLLFPKLS